MVFLSNIVPFWVGFGIYSGIHSKFSWSIPGIYIFLVQYFRKCLEIFPSMCTVSVESLPGRSEADVGAGGQAVDCSLYLASACRPPNMVADPRTSANTYQPTSGALLAMWSLVFPFK